MVLHLSQIGNVADMVPCPVLVHILILHLFAGQFLRGRERLETRTAVAPTTAEVVDLAHPGLSQKSGDETQDLFAFANIELMVLNIS